MNADTSGFSMTLATRILKPHLKNLSFKRLSDYVGNTNFHDSVGPGGAPCKFDLWSGHVMLPACLTLSDLVYGIQIERNISRRTSGRIHSIDYHWLILKRSDEGNVGLMWYMQTTKFVPYKSDNNCSHFTSVSTIVRSVNSEREFLQHLNSLHGFAGKFVIGVQAWIVDCIDTRAKALSQLKDLRDRFSLESVTVSCS